LALQSGSANFKLERGKEMLKVAKMNVYPYDKGGKMVAFLDVTFSLLEGGDGVLVVRGCKIFRSDDGGYNVALPSRKDEKDPNKYYPIISIDKEKAEGQELISYLNQEATKAYNARVRNGGTKKPQQTANKQASPTTNKQTQTNVIGDEDLPF
jgi:DNA-binding cell septation regulator SpoVG